MSDPRYPIGPFIAPTGWDEHLVALWRSAIAELPRTLRATVSSLDDAALDTPYREGGWTPRQIVHHLADSHLNAYMRFKLALTEENPIIRPYSQDAFARLPDSTQLSVAPSLEMLEGLHVRWGMLLGTLDDAALQRTFVHPEYNATFTLGRTLALYAWHGQHHVAQIIALCRSRGW
jgi:uncharacterized damage-inducible protein DinB